MSAPFPHSESGAVVMRPVRTATTQSRGTEMVIVGPVLTVSHPWAF